MTLDERIEKDLGELYEKGEIIDAHDLSVRMFGASDMFASFGMPGHFCGDRNAETVMVMLNPGKDVSKANNPIATHKSLVYLNIDTSSLKRFIESYKIASQNYGTTDRERLDNFDIKQAAFLNKWPDCGVDIPYSFPDNNDEDGRKAVKEAVLNHKLQLELVPYASRKFDTSTNGLNLLFPYVETLFDEIFRVKRKYVIFCSDFFEKVFTAYNKLSAPYRISFVKKYKQSGIIQNHLTYCTPIRIENQARSVKAVIAHSFPSQALPNAYNKMIDYGKFCFDCFNKL